MVRAGREWLTDKLRDVAREQATIFYGQLCDEMHSKAVITLEPHLAALAALLGQINVIEHDHGRPLLSAIVLSKDTGIPGIGNSESTSVGTTLSAKVSGSSRCANAMRTGAIARCEA